MSPTDFIISIASFSLTLLLKPALTRPQNLQPPSPLLITLSLALTVFPHTKHLHLQGFAPPGYGSKGLRFAASINSLASLSPIFTLISLFCSYSLTIHLKYREIPISVSAFQAYIYNGIKENSWASAYCECSN